MTQQTKTSFNAGRRFNLGGCWRIPFEQFWFLFLKLLQKSDCCCSFIFINILVLKHLWCFHLTLGIFPASLQTLRSSALRIGRFSVPQHRAFLIFSVTWLVFFVVFFLTIPASVRALTFWLVREIHSFLVSPFHYYFRCCSCYANSRFFFF